MPHISQLHIDCKEVISAVLAARRWAQMWRNIYSMYMALWGHLSNKAFMYIFGRDGQ